MDISTSKEFNNGTVLLSIPKQAGLVDVRQLDLPEIETLPVIPIGFHPFRLVINLKFVDPMQPDKEVIEFDPPVEVRIRYTKEDYAIVKAVRRDLCLGFWDGERWIRFTPRKHNFHLEYDTTPENGGWGVVSISNWGDPPHAWGT